MPAVPATVASNHKLNWFGTVRGRLGWLPSQRYLLYVTGGLAYGDFESNYLLSVDALAPVAFSRSSTRTGWTIGGGIEGMLWDRWTAKIEYLYLDLGSINGLVLGGTLIAPNVPSAGLTTVTAANINTGTKFTDNILRIGLNYRFGPNPVSARY